MKRTSAPPEQRVGSPDVVLWYSALSPYMAERFSRLHERGNLAFECWFNRERNAGRSWIVEADARRFPHRFLRPVSGKRGTISVPLNTYLEVRPKVLITFHADTAVASSIFHHLAPGGKLVYYVERTFDEWTPRSRWKELAKLALFRLADAFLTAGEDAEAYVRQYAGSSAATYRLEHAVQVDRFAAAMALRQRRRDSSSDAPFTFIYVGKLGWQKGVGTLLEAFAMLRRVRPDVRLTLAGDGPDAGQYEASSNHGSRQAVRFVPFTQTTALPALLAEADAFVFPTRGDPYGLVVDEAMAAGLPVISSMNAGEIRSRVRHEETGLLVRADDPRALADAMARLAEDQPWAHKLGERGYLEIRTHTPDRWAEQLEKAVKEIIAPP